MQQISASRLNQLQEPSLPSPVPIYPWVESSLWSIVLFKDLSVMNVIRTRTQTPEVESGSLNRSATIPHPTLLQNSAQVTISEKHSGFEFHL